MREEFVSIILGDEHDAALRCALRAVLVEAGAKGITRSSGIGGSQEVELIKVEIDGELLVIESETFVGLTVSGPKPVVDDVVRRVRHRMAR